MAAALWDWLIQKFSSVLPEALPSQLPALIGYVFCLVRSC
ncbi:hypothetical protein Hsw_2261 [Hymenobacter swuensis DY53]|uniref:Uncharacterized protein n=1 Tax=Hymenobacter swuensis DY53 TaxID=1227739 RepID=W8F5H1_9BACT|nr:hypothetical protein Hsw_2261 [Hymenobacter swuensis DY53]